MALTEDLTFQLSDTGVVLNAEITPGAAFVDIEDVRGLDSPEFRESERDHEGVDGGFLDAEFEKGRSIILSGTAVATVDTIEEFLDSLKDNFAPSRVLLPFYYKAAGRAERVLFVKPRGVKYDWTQAHRTGTCAVQFQAYAEIPIIFDATLQSFDLAIGAFVFTGFAYNKAYDFGYGGASSSVDGVAVINGGNRETPVVLTITGPVLNPQIVSDTAGKTMLFNIDLLVGETLVIDSYYRTVKLNGTTNRRNVLVAPTWFHLAKGTNTLRFRGESGTGTLNVSFRSAWR